MIVLQSIAAFLLILGPLVFVHELGHFLVAKALRIGVPIFPWDSARGCSAFVAAGPTIESRRYRWEATCA